MCRDAAHLLAGGGGTGDSTAAAAIELPAPFDLKAAERVFFIIRAALFHSTFSLGYTADELASMKPEIQWNYACHLAVDDPEGVLAGAVQEAELLFKQVCGARFLTEIYTRGCHWIPRMLA
jgi:hypothetical protein